MLVDVSMKSDENCFTVERWWAVTPQFVLHALADQLKAAQAIWPELNRYAVCSLDPNSPTISRTITDNTVNAEPTATGDATNEATLTDASKSVGAVALAQAGNQPKLEPGMN